MTTLQEIEQQQKELEKQKERLQDQERRTKSITFEKDRMKKDLDADKELVDAATKFFEKFPQDRYELVVKEREQTYKATTGYGEDEELLWEETVARQQPVIKRKGTNATVEIMEDIKYTNYSYSPVKNGYCMRISTNYDNRTYKRPQTVHEKIEGAIQQAELKKKQAQTLKEYIDETVEEMKNKYPGVEVNYDSAWKSSPYLKGGRSAHIIKLKFTNGLKAEFEVDSSKRKSNMKINLPVHGFTAVDFLKDLDFPKKE